MHWLWDAMWARIGWALGELVLALAFVSAIIVVAVTMGVLKLRKQARCHHTNEYACGVAGTEIRCVECDKHLRHSSHQKLTIRAQSEGSKP